MFSVIKKFFKVIYVVCFNFKDLLKDLKIIKLETTFTTL